MYLIKNGRIHVGDGSVLDGYDLLTKGRVIRKIDKEIICPDAEVIDAAGCEVFPGFIDPHSMIGALGIPARCLDNQEKSDPITPEMNVKYAVDPDEVNAQEFYKSGITTIGLAPGNSNIMGGQIAVVKTAPMKMKSRLVKEKAALKCSVTASVKAAYGKRNQMPMTRMGSFWKLQEAIRKAEESAKNADEMTESDEVIQTAFVKKEMPVFVAAERIGEIEGVLHMMGERQVPVVLVDGYEFGNALEAMKQQHTGLVLGNLNAGSRIAKHGMELCKIKELADSGNRIAFTNSSGGASEGREVFLWTAIEVYRARVDAEEVVKMMTIHPAAMLGVSDRIGALREGMDADLSIYTGHPVKTYDARVKHSIINGEVVF